MKRILPGVVFALLIASLPACDQGQSLAPEAQAAAPPSAAPAPAPTTVTAGICAGKAPGEHTCDANRLVRCDDLAGNTTAEKTCDGLSTCDAAAADCQPACPPGEVYIPPTGPEGFTMGAAEQGIRDKPHTVVLTRPFCMDATETTVASYKTCVERQGCSPPRPELRWSTYPDKLDYPVNKTSWVQAKYFCEQQGKSLPTEAQWEWAATGGDGRKWPWGNDTPTCEHADFVPGLYPYNPKCEGAPKGYRRCNGAPDTGCGGGGPSAVGSHPRGDKVWPAGTLHDMGGNVWEWVLDNLTNYQAGSREVDPLHVTREEEVHGVRGGGWNRSGRGILASFRGAEPPDYQVSGLGFRCVRNAPHGPASAAPNGPASAAASAPGTPNGPRTSARAAAPRTSSSGGDASSTPGASPGIPASSPPASAPASARPSAASPPSSPLPSPTLPSPPLQNPT